MLDYQLLPDQGILKVHPSAPLAARDFAQMAEVVDRYLADHEYLNGVLISSNDFPGWEDFASFISHLRFVGDHHQRIKKVAAVSDDKLLTIAPKIVDHFVDAEVKHFSSAEENTAVDWIKSA
jgi:SpoIIAA-like